MHTADLKTLYEYDDWATEKILAQTARLTPEQYAAPANIPWGSIRGTLVHVASAERAWRGRCQEGVSRPPLAEADFPTFDALITFWRQERAALRAYLATLGDDDLDTMIAYTSFKGQPHQARLSHILTHVANHATQHRSEVAILLTDYGYSPGDLDYIYYVLGMS
jgi:uncharacterized damage-inducible protein DinB